MLRSKDALVLAVWADGLLAERGNFTQLSMQGEGALPTSDGLSSLVQIRFTDAHGLADNSSFRFGLRKKAGIWYVIATGIYIHMREGVQK